MRSVDLGHLVDHDHVAENIESSAAELFRPGNAEQAELAHFLDVRPGKLCFRIELRGDRRYFTTSELADHVANREVLLREVERIVHWVAL